MSLPPKSAGSADFFSESEWESRVVGCVVSIGELSGAHGSEEGGRDAAMWGDPKSMSHFPKLREQSKPGAAAAWGSNTAAA